MDLFSRKTLCSIKDKREDYQFTEGNMESQRRCVSTSYDVKKEKKGEWNEAKKLTAKGKNAILMQDSLNKNESDISRR